MQKTEFVHAFYERLKDRKIPLSKMQTKAVVDELFTLITETLEGGERVQVSGFGTFEVRQRAGRNGVNPQTLEHIIIPPSRSVGFTVSHAVKQRIRASLAQISMKLS